MSADRLNVQARDPRHARSIAPSAADNRLDEFAGLQRLIGNAAITHLVGAIQRCGDHVSPG
jgi:hypothetical protein